VDSKPLTKTVSDDSVPRLDVISCWFVQLKDERNIDFIVVDSKFIPRVNHIGQDNLNFTKAKNASHNLFVQCAL